MVAVKICGLRTLEAADAIEAAGARFAGLNFVSWSRRCVDVASAKALMARLKTTVPVGVFADQPVEPIASALGLEWVQLHGGEAPETCARLSERHRVIKALTLETAAQVEAYAPHVELFLFDAAQPGSGRAFDWSRLPKTDRPFLLAGGLSPDNVAEAIATVSPFGVDTASGVETDGVQDPKRIRSFVEACLSSGERIP